MFSGLRPTPAAKLERLRTAYFVYPAETTVALGWIAQEAAADQCDIYMGAHLTTRWRRRKADAAPLASLYVDLDHGAIPTDTVPPPSVVIESSPGRLQCYWRLTTPLPPVDGEALNRRLACAVGADSSGWDLTQLLRVPGTVNRKYADRAVVTVVRETGRVYELGQLVDPLPKLPLVRRVTEMIRAPATAWSSVRLSRAARRVWDGETAKHTPDGRVDRSASLVQIARVLFDAGASAPVIVAALAERDVALGWEKYRARRDARDADAASDSRPPEQRITLKWDLSPR